LRAETATELVRLQKRLGTTFIQVTHDQQEALTMADRIGVMRDGRIAQVGSPREIYERPVNRFVAEFMGVSNLWDCTVRDDGMTVELPGIDGVIRLGDPAPAGPAVLGVRAERIRIGTIANANRLSGVLEQTAYAGDSVTHSMRIRNRTLVFVTEPAHSASFPDKTVTVSFPPSACMVFRE